MIRFIQKIIAGRRVAGLEARIADLQAEIDRKSAMPGDYRYWEGRYRDEHRLTEKLQQQMIDLHAQLANMETEGPKRALEKFNDAQAARAMSRNTKHHFRAYQAAVKVILDRLDQLGRKNHVTKEDLRKLRELRIELGNQINREI